MNAVWEGRADCAFSIAPERRNLEAVPLHTDPLLVVLPLDHPLAGAPFFPHRSLSPRAPTCSRARAPPEMESVVRGQRGHPPTCASRWPDYAVMSMVSAGLGFSVLPSLILSRPSVPLAVRRPSASAPAASSSPCARATPPRPPPAPSPKSPENGSPRATELAPSFRNAYFENGRPNLLFSPLREKSAIMRVLRAEKSLVGKKKKRSCELRKP